MVYVRGQKCCLLVRISQAAYKGALTCLRIQSVLVVCYAIHRASKLLVREAVTRPVAKLAVLDLIYYFVVDTTELFLVACGDNLTFASQQRWLVS